MNNISMEKEEILKELRRHLHTRARNLGRGGAEAIYDLAKANIAKKKKIKFSRRGMEKAE